jgi:hypothetical protein
MAMGKDRRDRESSSLDILIRLPFLKFKKLYLLSIRAVNFIGQKVRGEGKGGLKFISTLQGGVTMNLFLGLTFINLPNNNLKK